MLINDAHRKGESVPSSDTTQRTSSQHWSPFRSAKLVTCGARREPKETRSRRESRGIHLPSEFQQSNKASRSNGMTAWRIHLPRSRKNRKNTWTLTVRKNAFTTVATIYKFTLFSIGFSPTVHWGTSSEEEMRFQQKLVLRRRRGGEEIRGMMQFWAGALLARDSLDGSLSLQLRYSVTWLFASWSRWAWQKALLAWRQRRPGIGFQ